MPFVLSLVFPLDGRPFVFLNRTKPNSDGRLALPDPEGVRNTLLADVRDEATAITLKELIEELLASESFANLSPEDELVDLENAIHEISAGLSWVSVSRQASAKEMEEEGVAYGTLEDDEDDWDSSWDCDSSVDL